MPRFARGPCAPVLLEAKATEVPRALTALRFIQQHYRLEAEATGLDAGSPGGGSGSARAGGVVGRLKAWIVESTT